MIHISAFCRAVRCLGFTRQKVTHGEWLRAEYGLLLPPLLGGLGAYCLCRTGLSPSPSQGK